MFAPHAIELEPHAESAECDQRHKREAGRDHKSELRHERKDPITLATASAASSLTAQPGHDRVARHAQEGMRVGRRGRNHHVLLAAKPQDRWR